MPLAAKFVADALKSCNVQYIFALSGDQILPIFDSLNEAGIQIIHARHEEAVVQMADAYGRLTERAGVALVTAGPGHANTTAALLTANRAESPVVLLSGASSLSRRGQGDFQEMDQAELVRPVTKAAWYCDSAADIWRHVTDAMNLAVQGRPGPVSISFPTDVLQQDIADISGHQPSNSLHTVPATPDDRSIREVASILNEAKKPLILCGPAMTRGECWTECKNIQLITRIPVLPSESARGVYDPELRRVPQLFGKADVVLLLGKSLDFTLQFGSKEAFSEQCRFLQIAVDTRLSNSARIEKIIQCDSLQAAQLLASVMRQMRWNNTNWELEVHHMLNDTPPGWDKLAASDSAPLHPLRICAAVQPFISAGGIMVSDGGEFSQWATAGLQGDIMLNSSPVSVVGCAIPMAVAAKLVHPEKTVFAMTGDGGFGYHAFELDTAVRYNLPIVVVVGNDAKWNAEHRKQNERFDRVVETELRCTPYEEVARGLGAHGELVTEPSQLRAALERAIQSKRPACVNVHLQGVGTPQFELSGENVK